MNQKYLLIFVLLFVKGFTFSQDTTFSDEYFKLIKTYSTIDDVYDAHPELKPAPPHIVIGENEVLFFDDNGEVINRMPVVKEKKLSRIDPNFGKFPDGIKIHNNYNVIDATLLGVWEVYGYWDGIHVKPKNGKIYDKTGRFISNIKATHGAILSPNLKYFITVPFDETGKDTLFVYDMSGNKYPSVFIESFDPKIGFTNNSKFIKVYDYSIQKMLVIDPKGKLVFSHSVETGMVVDFFTSQNCNQILVSVFSSNRNYKAILIDNTNKVIWEKSIVPIRGCVFLENGNILLSVLEKNGKAVILLSADGNQIGIAKCTDVFQLNSSYIIVKNGGKYYEYKNI